MVVESYKRVVIMPTKLGYSTTRSTKFASYSHKDVILNTNNYYRLQLDWEKDGFEVDPDSGGL